jgi:hypothetical protein
MLMIQAGAIALIALILTPGLLFYFEVTPKLLVLLVAAGVALVPMRRSMLMGGILTPHCALHCAQLEPAPSRHC